MPTRPLWPLKNSQLARPAALAMTFTRREICDTDSPKTFTSPPAPTARMASRVRHGGWGDGCAISQVSCNSHVAYTAIAQLVNCVNWTTIDVQNLLAVGRDYAI